MVKFNSKHLKNVIDGAVFFSTLGNHDHAANRDPSKVEAIHVGYSKRNPSYYFPGLFYHFKKGEVCFWTVDTEVFDSKQAEFLRDSMAKEKCLWRVFFGHHPIKSSGRHGDASKLLQQNLQPLLEEWADFYFAGHDHDLADEGLIRSGVYPGFVQLVSGGGAKKRSVKSCSKTGCLFNVSSLGFIKVNVIDHDFQIEMINESGKVLYSKTYSK